MAADQIEVVHFLGSPSSYRNVESVECFETHGNLVFLAGSEAWKIKRAIRLPYMDFSTLEKRREACVREIEINRRYAPDIYVDSVPITRSRDGTLAFGGHGEIAEWAVHMRRFDQSALLSDIVVKQGISADLAVALADTVFHSHYGAHRARSASGAVQIDQLLASVTDSLFAAKALNPTEIVRFAGDAAAELAHVASALDERATAGHVRRCHGDLHLGNIVLWQGKPTLFDAIEFDDAIATIDTLYDLAFLLMDLDRFGEGYAGNVVLNRYLWRSREDLDLKGVRALPLFLALRAAIRARVLLDRAKQKSEDAPQHDKAQARDYMQSALRYLAPTSPRLVVVAGLSGTGKSTLAATLAPRLGPPPGAVHLRSDLERKALFSVDETTRLSAEAYTDDVNAELYAVLLRKARLVLQARHSVVVDAVYVAEERRSAIEAIATELGIPFHGLWLTAPADKLFARVATRRNDPSDATADVIRRQMEEDTGVLSRAWTRIDAGGSIDETATNAASAMS